MRAVLSVCLVAALSACATTRQVQMTTAFDAGQAQAMLTRGTTIVRGSALIRQQGGGVVTCAGTEVALTPATAYATERMHIIYGSVLQGYRSAAAPNWINPPGVPASTDARYEQFSRKTLCNAQGEFEFADVAPGSFYITTTVAWRVGYNVQGGYLMKRVDLTAQSPVVNVVLTPP